MFNRKESYNNHPEVKVEYGVPQNESIIQIDADRLTEALCQIGFKRPVIIEVKNSERSFSSGKAVGGKVILENNYLADILADVYDKVLAHAQGKKEQKQDARKLTIGQRLLFGLIRIPHQLIKMPEIPLYDPKDGEKLSAWAEEQGQNPTIESFTEMFIPWCTNIAQRRLVYTLVHELHHNENAPKDFTRTMALAALPAVLGLSATMVMKMSGMPDRSIIKTITEVATILTIFPFSFYGMALGEREADYASIQHFPHFEQCLSINMPAFERRLLENKEKKIG